MSLHHFDFYRLNDAGMVGQELAETLEDTKAVVAVEWGDTVEGILPDDYVRVVLSRVSTAEDDRRVEVTCSNNSNYLLEGLT